MSEIEYPEGSIPVGSVVVKLWIEEDGGEYWNIEEDFPTETGMSQIVGLLELAKLRFLWRSGFGRQLAMLIDDDEEDDDE